MIYSTESRPVVYSEWRPFSPGDDVIFDVTPPKDETREIEAVRFLLCAEKALISITDPLWIHSAFQFLVGNSTIWECPLFCVADQIAILAGYSRLENLEQRQPFNLFKTAYHIYPEQEARVAVNTARAVRLENKYRDGNEYEMLMVIEMTKGIIVRL